MTDEVPSLPKRKHAWTVLATLLLAAVLLYFAVRNVNWAETIGILSSGKVFGLTAALFFFSISCVVRALRWRVLLGAQKRISALTVFWAMMTGYLGNSWLPARAGEVIRSVFVGERGGISKSFSLATALTERLADAVILVSASAIALLTLPSLPEQMLQAMRVMAVVGFVGAVVVFIAPRMSRFLESVLLRAPLPHGLREKLINATNSFLDGARALQHPTRLAQFLFFSAVLWSIDTLVGYTVAKALGLTLNPAQVFVLLAALGIASAVPSTPGYVGVYQFVAVKVLVPFGLTDSQALAFIVAFQAIMYIGITFWGLLGLWGPGSRKGEVVIPEG